MIDLTNDVHAAAEDIARRHPQSGAVGVVTDVTDADACDALIATAVNRDGKVDVLAHATATPQRKVPRRLERRRGAGPTVQLTPAE